MWLTNLKIVLVVLGTLGLYTLVANAIPQLESEVPQELSFSGEVSVRELISAGEDLYQGAGQCTTCHGLGERAPNLLSDHGGEGTIGQRCGDRVQGEDCKAYIYASMGRPGSVPRGGLPTHHARPEPDALEHADLGAGGVSAVAGR